MDAPTLERIDAGVKRMLTAQEQAREWRETADTRLAAIEQNREAVAGALTKHDETLTRQESWIKEVEEKANRGRHGVGALALSGGDSLLDAMSDNLRKWIPYVANLSGAAGLAFGGGSAGAAWNDSAIRRGDLAPTKRSASIAQAAALDPIKLTAVAGWLRARIKASVAHRDALPENVKRWNDEARKLEAALGGNAGDLMTKADLQEDTAAEGGNLIPTVTEAMIGWLMKDASVVRRMGATTLSMTTKTHNLPTLANDFSVAWYSEEGTITDSAPATPFGSGALVANKQAGLVTISNELVEDNIVNLIDFVLTHLLNLMGRSEDLQALEGTGSPFNGLFTVSGVTDVAGGSAALDKDMLTKMIFGGEEGATMESSAIFAHPWIMRDAIGLLTGTAGAVFFPFAQQQGIPGNIFGIPVGFQSGILRNRGAGTNETTTYHGNPAFIIVGDRLGTRFVVNPWGGAGSEFEKDQILLRLTRRVGILIWVPAYFTKLTAVIVAA